MSVSTSQHFNFVVRVERDRLLNVFSSIASKDLRCKDGIRPYSAACCINAAYSNIRLGLRTQVAG